MAYKVAVEPEAQKEIDNAIEYSISDDINVQLNLLNDIEQAYKALELNPFFQIRKVVSLFNTSQDPKKYV